MLELNGNAHSRRRQKMQVRKKGEQAVKSGRDEAVNWSRPALSAASGHDIRKSRL